LRLEGGGDRPFDRAPHVDARAPVQDAHEPLVESQAHESPLARAASDADVSLARRIREAKSKTSPCTSEPGACEKPAAPYERIQKGQPGYQWGDNGGYCRSLTKNGRGEPW
jgi:hypothetical protein